MSVARVAEPSRVDMVRSLCELPRGSASVLYTSLCPVWRAATRVGGVSARGNATADDIPVACLRSRMALVGSKIAAISRKALVVAR